jgi:glycosyltransferase involved in cell wall biosynthesis
LRVLHLIQRYPPAVGGSETWCREVVRHQARMGDRVRVLTLDILEEEEFWREPELDGKRLALGPLDWDQGVLVRRYRRSLPVYHLYHLVLGPILDRLLKIYAYGPHSVEMYGRLLPQARWADVVHLHTLPFPHNLFGYLAARLCRKRVVVTPHFHPDHPHYERWSSYWLLRHCDAVLAVSPFEKEYLAARGVDPTRIAVTGCGVHLEGYAVPEIDQALGDLRQRHDLPADSRLILFVGRKADYKGIDTLIEATPRLPERHRAVLLLVGPGSPWFDELYGRLSPRERARILDLGTVEEAEKVALLHLADVLALPSRFEAFGIVLLEAWACGTPVVTSSRGALPSVVGDGGLTFEYGDAVGLAERLDALLSDPRLARRLAEAGRRQVEERYTWDRIAQAARASYLATAGDPRAGAPGAAGLQPGSAADSGARTLPSSHGPGDPVTSTQLSPPGTAGLQPGSSGRAAVETALEGSGASPSHHGPAPLGDPTSRPAPRAAGAGNDRAPGAPLPATEARRILICSNHFPPHVLGGAELVAHRQGRALQRLGHEVRVFAGRPAASAGRRHRVESGAGELPTTWVHLTEHDRSGEHWDFQSPPVAAAFASLLDDFGPDVVHFHNQVGLSLQAIDECRKRRIPTVLTLHDYWGICFKNTMTKNDGSLCLQGGFDCLGCRDTLGDGAAMPSPVRNAHLLLSLSRVDRLLSPSRFLARRYVANGFPESRIQTLGYGTDTRRFRPTEQAQRQGELTVAYIGYLGPHKGVDVLLRAIARLGEHGGVRVLVAGAGEAFPSLESLARDLGIQQRVRFLGRIPNDRVPALYRQIDVLAAPSVWPENSPLTIDEAMACGVPVVASALGGMVEQIEDGVTGFLVPPGDPGALAERIGRFAAHPELAQEMGLAALESARRRSLDDEMARLEEIYRQVILEAAASRSRHVAPARQEAPDGAAILLYLPADHWRWPARELFSTLPEVERALGRRLLVCRADLADEETLATARLLLLPAAAHRDLATAVEALARGIPVLAHADLEELTELCRLSGGGLWYAGHHELATALERLLSDESLRAELASRGAEYVARR